jgi:hypothetical protein
MTFEQLKQALHRIDLKLRPQIVFLHPDDYAEVMKSIPDIQDRILLTPTPAIDRSHAVMMDRSWLES